MADTRLRKERKRMDAEDGGLRVGYVVKVFPRLSETFILNEILELERQGIAVDIFSLKPPTEPRYHGDLSRLKASVTYLSSAEGSEAWRKIRADCLSADPDPYRVGESFLQAARLEEPTSLKLFLQALVLAEAVRSRGILHLHAHFATSATSVAMMAHNLAGVTFSFTAHAKDIYHRETDLQNLAAAFDQAAFAVTVTDHNVATLTQIAPGAYGKLRRIYNGVSLERLENSPLAAADPPVIVSVGRLVEKKGFPYLVQACRLLKDRGRSFRCLIVGSGDREQEITELIGQLDLDSEIELAGALPHEAVVAAIRQGTVMALPCIVGEDGNRDALPTVLLEAMALGRPVVSTDLPGVTEIVDHEINGLLCPQRDPSGLADALMRVLCEPGLAVSLGRAARAKAEDQFSLTHNVAELASCFRQAAAPLTGLFRPEERLGRAV
jgi:colanic acid/amylovoran biosynthesis glycosyltransferase